MLLLKVKIKKERIALIVVAVFNDRIVFLLDKGLAHALALPDSSVT